MKMNLPLIYFQNFPFVEGAFRCKNGSMLTGFFLIDTGSAQNIFNCEAIHTLPTAMDGEKLRISGINNQSEICQQVSIEVQLDNNTSQEDFYISQTIHFEKMFGKNRIIGILGASYLIKHDLVLNYEQNMLHTSDPEVFKNTEMDFTFPMGFGLKSYGVPLVGFEKDDNCFYCVADSGCNVSAITQKAIEEGADSCSWYDENSTVTGVGGAVNTRMADVCFSLLSLGNKEGEFVHKVVSMIFNVWDGDAYICKGNNDTETGISALLGNDFMFKNKWILDFSRGVIYSTKANH